MIVTLADLQAWRAAARAHGRTPNLAQLCAQLHAAALVREPWRRLSMFEVDSFNPARRRQARRKYRFLLPLLEEIKQKQHLRSLRQFDGFAELRAEPHRFRTTRPRGKR